MKTLVEKYGDPLVVVYVDLTAAYDHIPRDFLFRVISLRTGAMHLVEILEKIIKAQLHASRVWKLGLMF